MKLKPLSLFIGAIFGVLSVHAAAIEPITVRDIHVEGLQRTELGTVFNYLPVKVGGKFDDNVARESIKALFATGFFNDVRIEVEKDVLIVMVQERPTIAQISINGADIVPKDTIRQALKTQNFAEGRIFQQDILDAAIIELKQQYYSRGRYSVNVKAETTRLERNRVGIKLDISEGDVARIKRINFVGNTVFDDGDLEDLFSLSVSGWMTWYTKSDHYSKPKFSADIEKLKSLYQDNGYLDFNVESSQVSISENKKEIYLSVSMSEGNKFTIGDIKFAGNLIVEESELRRLLDINSGDVYSREKIVRANASIAERLGKEGYAFANVNPVPNVDKEKNIVGFTFYVDPGRKTFVRKVNISGNLLTRDEVVRREVRQLEAAPYNGEKIKRSKQRLDQLGSFSEINIETPVVQDAVDQVDVDIKLTERKTGNFNIGIGYGGEGAVLIASLSQSNFFGSGKSLSLEANTSQSNTTYAMNVLNPYATPDGVSFGWSLYSRYSDPSEIGLGGYNTAAKGGGFTLGLPVTDENKVTFSANVEKLKINTTTDSPNYATSFVSKYGSDNNIYTIGLGWSRDTRDSAYYPTTGNFHSLNSEIEIPGSTTQYYKLSAENKIFYPVDKNLTAMWNIEAGYARQFGNSEVPFYKHYYAGGIGSVRGYKNGSLSSKDEYNNAMGGTKRFVNNFELLTPMPGLKDDKSVRLSTFVDAGYAWGADESVSYKDIRAAAGVAVTWISPVGPIKMNLAKPIKPREGDKVETFQIMLGQVF